MLHGDKSYKKVPQYEENELRPNQRNPDDKEDRNSSERKALKFAQGNMMVHDYNDYSEYPACSPASANWTPGLPSRAKNKAGDEGHATIQPGIPRVR